MNTRSRKNRLLIDTRSVATRKPNNEKANKLDESKQTKRKRSAVVEVPSPRQATRSKSVHNCETKKSRKIADVSKAIIATATRPKKAAGRDVVRSYKNSTSNEESPKNKLDKNVTISLAKSRIAKKKLIKEVHSRKQVSALKELTALETTAQTEQLDEKAVKIVNEPAESCIEKTDRNDVGASCITTEEHEKVKEVEETCANDVEEERSQSPGRLSNGDLTEIQVITIEEITDAKNGWDKPLYHECVYCDRKFLYYKNLRAHIRAKHNEIFEALYNRNKDKSNYIHCEHCDRIFKYRKNMKAHIRQKHPDTLLKLPLDDLIYECSLCPRKFKYKKNLVAHLRQKHTTQSETSLPEIMEAYGPECKLCGAKFMYKKMLNAHIKKEHCQNEDVKKESSEKEVGPFMCNNCDSVFIHKRNMNAHIRTKHSAIPAPRNFKCAECGDPFQRMALLNRHISRVHTPKPDGSVKPLRHVPKRCPLCTYQTKHRLLLLKHFADAHEVDVEVDYIQFDNAELFAQWKDELENETKCRYNKTSFKVYPDRTTTILQCHRSGHYRSRGSGCRLLKAQGSKKMNAYCPAQLHVSESPDGVRVRFTSTHVGHENELCHVYLKQRDREIIAQKLALGIAPEDIIAETDDPEYSDRRESYINLKDIYNVKASFNLKLPDHEEPELLSVDEWVETRQSDVLFYAKQGSKLLPELGMEDDDFMLILMNDLQKEMFCKFGGNIVCVQTIRNPSKYAFLLTTVMVLDEYCESFPAAFMFSNRVDENIGKVFFHHISTAVGPIQPNVFMSDKNTELYAAWAETMLPARRQLFCTWHVLRDWKNNAVKIPGDEKRRSVTKWLEVEVLKQVDYYAFEEALNSFLESSDEDIQEFLDYFIKNYLETIPSWAYCFRLDAQINTNLSTETFYRVLKYVNAKDSCGVVSIESALHSLTMHMEYKKRCRKITSMKRFKHSKKIATIRRNHKNALNANVDESCVTVIEDGWMVPSFRNASDELCEMFVVRKNELPSCVDCKLVCPSCNVCIHSYSCSCLDYSIKFTMCEHIHYLCTMLKTKVEFEEIEESTLDVVEFDSDGSIVTLSPVSACENECQPDERKKIVGMKFDELLSQCTGSVEKKEKKPVLESLKQLDSKLSVCRKDS